MRRREALLLSGGGLAALLVVVLALNETTGGGEPLPSTIAPSPVSVAATTTTAIDAVPSPAQEFAAAFAEFVGAGRSAPGKAIQTLPDAIHDCYPRGDPDYGWCEGAGQPGKTTTVWTKYRASNPKAFRFSTHTDSVKLQCGDFGAHQVVRTWPHACTIKRHCKMTGGPAKGLELLLTYMTPKCSHAAGRTKALFASPEYLWADVPVGQVYLKQGLGRPDPGW